MIKKLFPVGSECFVNAGLDNSKLQNYKIYYSPFNGTRIIDLNANLPLADFISNYNSFKDTYLDKNNWTLGINPVNKNDICAYNYKLNICRLHLKKEEPFSFIDKTRQAFKTYEETNNILLIDLNEYMFFTNKKIIELKNILDASNIRYLPYVRMNKFIHTYTFHKCLTNNTFNSQHLVNINLNLCVFDLIQIPCTSSSDDILDYLNFYNTKGIQQLSSMLY